MTELDAIAPKSKGRVIDLVAEAGVDVTDWANFKSGLAKASVNPKYCYEWSFVEPGKLILLNLWHLRNELSGGRIIQTNNFRENAKTYSKMRKQSWAKRANKIDEALRIALRDNLPIRVILLAGEMKDLSLQKTEASKVKLRALDPEPWTILEYDHDTGRHTVARGVLGDQFVDQFSVDQSEKAGPRRGEASGTVFERDPEVRRRALLRANGSCQLCGERGFEMPRGAIYLETHHITPLAEGGADHLNNVVALCPNDHRRAHYSVEAAQMREQLLKIVRSL